MKFNTKTRYGIRTMIEIALHDKRGGIFQKDIAQQQDISVKYLDHIIHALKVAELITRNTNNKGKYILTKASKDISMYDIYRAFENEIAVVECLAPFSPQCAREKDCRIICFWSSLNSKVTDHLSSTKLSDLTKNEND